MNGTEEAVTQAFQWGPVLIIVVPIMLGWVGTLIKGWLDRKKYLDEQEQERKSLILEKKLQSEEFSEQNKFVMDRLKGFENKLVDISMKLLENSQDREFQLQLANMFRNEATDIIDFNVDLNPKYRHLLMKIARELEDFALRFYYSNMRGKRKIEQYLRIDMNSRIAQLENFMKQMDTKIRFYEYGTGNKAPINFVDYIRGSQIYNQVDELIDRLEVNGFTKTSEVIELFQDFIADFFKEALRLINVWEKLEIFDAGELKELFTKDDVAAEFEEEKIELSDPNKIVRNKPQKRT